MNPMQSPLMLSICIATFRRADYIAQTLDSIIPQLTDQVELIVVDGASPDHTPEVLAGYVARCPRLRYVREPVNSGIDPDYDRAVSYARAEYCWLMTDDDLLVEGAIAEVLAKLGTNDLIVVNAEVCDKDLGRPLRSSMLAHKQDMTFDDAERLFVEMTAYLSFIGGVIVRRAWWLQRQREPYYGTLFVHVGALFQSPPIARAAVIGRPLIVIRFGNAMWSARSFEIWMFKWPELIWSFEHFSREARAAVTAQLPFRSFKRLIWFRAIGGYSIDEYRHFLMTRGNAQYRLAASAIARLPGRVANFCCAVYYFLRADKSHSGMELYDLARSTHSTWFARRVDAMRRSL